MTQAIFPENFQAPQDYLKDKIILVTGAGDGIGKEAAIQYARYGAILLLLGRTQKKLEATYDAIMENHGQQPAILPVDLATLTSEDAQQIARKIEEEFGRLDGLLHNASLLGQLSPLSDYEPTLWQKVMTVNLHSEFLLTQACLPLLRKSQAASILFTSSGVGNQGRAFWGAYSVSKFATEGLAQVLADELEKTHIRVNIINPGATRTRMRAQAFPGEDPQTLSTPLDKMPLYIYLMGADGTQHHGQRFNA